MSSQGVPDVLDIEDGVLWVHSSLVLGRLTDQTLLAREGDEGGGGEGTLLVGNYTIAVRRRSLRGQTGGRAHTDLDIGALVVGDARVGRACSTLAIALWGNIAVQNAHQDRCQWHPRILRRSWCMCVDENYPRN